MEQQLLKNIDETNQELYAILGALDEKELNERPVPGGWTAGQVADHLIKSDRLLHHLFIGPTRKTTRAVDEQVNQFADVFLNFDTRLQSPGVILPDDRLFIKSQLLNELTTIRATLLDIAASGDLTRTATQQSPLGECTLLELLHFHLYHTKRHLNQLSRICIALGD